MGVNETRNTTGDFMTSTILREVDQSEKIEVSFCPAQKIDQFVTVQEATISYQDKQGNPISRFVQFKRNDNSKVEIGQSSKPLSCAPQLQGHLQSTGYEAAVAYRERLSLYTGLRAHFLAEHNETYSLFGVTAAFFGEQVVDRKLKGFIGKTEKAKAYDVLSFARESIAENFEIKPIGDYRDYWLSLSEEETLNDQSTKFLLKVFENNPSDKALSLQLLNDLTKKAPSLINVPKKAGESGQFLKIAEEMIPRFGGDAEKVVRIAPYVSLALYARAHYYRQQALKTGVPTYDLISNAYRRLGNAFTLRNEYNTNVGQAKDYLEELNIPDDGKEFGERGLYGSGKCTTPDCRTGRVMSEYIKTQASGLDPFSGKPNPLLGAAHIMKGLQKIFGPLDKRIGVSWWMIEDAPSLMSKGLVFLHGDNPTQTK